jgi:hypothetical protein
MGVKLPMHTLPFQPGEVDGEEQLEPGAQFLGGLVDGLGAARVVRLVVPGAAVQREPVDPRRLRLPDLPLVIVHLLALRGEANHVVRENMVPLCRGRLRRDCRRRVDRRKQEQTDQG